MGPTAIAWSKCAMTKTQRPKLLKRAALLSAILIVTGCQKMTPTAGISSAVCLAFAPITYSSRDTPETKREIVGHNAALAALCPIP